MASNISALEDYLKDELPINQARPNVTLGHADIPLSTSEIRDLALQGLWRGIKGVGSGLAQLPGDVWEGVKHPIDTLKGGLYTAGKAGKKIGAGETYLINKLFGTNFEQPKEDLLQDLPIGVNPRAFRAGSTAALLAAPALGEGLAGAALTSGATGALMAPEGETLKNTLGDALTGALLHGVSRTPNVVNSAVAKIARGKTPKDVIAQRVESLPDDVKVSIGDVTGSPKLQTLYHDVLGAIPGSGIGDATADLVEGLRNKTANLVKNLSHGHSDATIGKSIGNDIADLYERVNGQSGENFRQLAEKADANNIKMPSENTNLMQAATEEINKINKNPKEYLPSIDATLARDLNILSGGKSKFNKNLTVRIGNEVVPMSEWIKKQLPDEEAEAIPLSEADYSFKNAHQSRSNLLKKARDRKGKLEDYETGIYNRLADAQLNDIQNTISKSNVPELNQDLQNALDFHRQNVVPLKKNKTIRAIVDGGKTDNIHTTLSGDEYADVLRQLPQATRDKILYMHLEPRMFTDEMGNIKANPQGIVNKYENINAAIKSRLARPEVERDIMQLKSLGKVAEEPLKQAQRAFTGGRTTKNLVGGAYLWDLIHKLSSGDYLGAALHGTGLPLLANLGGRYLSSQRLKDIVSGKEVSPLNLFNPVRPVKISEGQLPLMNINVPPQPSPKKNDAKENAEALAKYLGYE